MKINNHGDIILKPIKTKKPPKTAEKAKKHILQSSDTTGNRHEVISNSFIYRWTKDGQEFLHSDKGYKIQHIGGDAEHGVQEVEAGTREVLHEMEHDPFQDELRVVID